MSDVTDVVNPATEQVIARSRSTGWRRPTRRWPGPMPPDRPGGRWPRPTGPACCAGSPPPWRTTTRSWPSWRRPTWASPSPRAATRSAMVAEVLYFYAGAVDKHRGATVPVAGGVDMTFHEPLGVVGAIIPWNFPVAITSWKVGPALATGNTIVVKPAEITPLTAVRLAELGLEAGLPEGVLQVVTGKGSVVGTRLAEHPDVAKVAFTGSTEVGTGRDVPGLGHHQAGHAGAGRQVGLGGLRRRRPGPGGRSAPGRDVRQRRPGLLRPQPDPRPAQRAMDEFLDLLADAVRAWTVGDPTDPAIQDGPDGHRRPPRRGGRLPGRGDGCPGRAGARPTPPARCPTAPGSGSPRRWWPRRSPEWRMAREEIFGPIVAVIPFDDEDGGRPTGQRHAVRAVRVDLDPGRRPVAAHGPGRAGRQPVGQLEQLGAGADQLRRHEAVGLRARARPRGAGLLHRGEERLRLDRRLSTVSDAHRVPGRTITDGPVAVVTGASRGIGAGLAAHFAARGLRLGLCARTAPEPPRRSRVGGRRGRREGRRRCRTVLRRQSWRGSAGSTCGSTTPGSLEPVGPLADAEPGGLDRNVATNVLGVMHGTAAFARHVRARPGAGSLVNMSSGAATTPYRGWAAYCASKAAVEMLTEVVGLEEADAGLLAYAVAPGVVDTDMQALIRAVPPDGFPDVGAVPPDPRRRGRSSRRRGSGRASSSGVWIRRPGGCPSRVAERCTSGCRTNPVVRADGAGSSGRRQHCGSRSPGPGRRGAPGRWAATRGPPGSTRSRPGCRDRGSGPGSRSGHRPPRRARRPPAGRAGARSPRPRDRMATPSSATACRVDPAGACSTARRNRRAASSGARRASGWRRRRGSRTRPWPGRSRRWRR